MNDSVKIKIPLFKGINIFGREVTGQILVINGTACIVPLNEEVEGHVTHSYMSFDGHHICQDEDNALWIRDPSTIEPAGEVEVEVC